MPPRPSEPPDFAASQLFLRRLAYSLVRDEARAEDLVQETWATWVERRPSGLAEPRAWLARVLRNRAFNLKRADARRSQHEELAGRPDPSGPETDGTLEAQAQLLEALRKLEEPFRSTLVQRYYHDLPPSAIAERAGAPLNTVKARLARGLEKLRAEMDRRYHGDRRAWCHWLTSLGPGVPLPIHPGAPRVPPGELPRSTSGRPWTAGASSTVTGKLLLVGGLVLSALVVNVWRTQRAPVEPFEPLIEAETTRVLAELAPPRRERAGGVPPVGPQPLAQAPPSVAPPPTPAFVAVLPFDWPQLGGSPAHAGLTTDAQRKDEILAPRTRFSLPGLSGQPTIAGADLYSGGLTLTRVDLRKDERHDPGPEVAARIQRCARRLPRGDPDWEEALSSQGLARGARVAAAPALAGDFVLARMLGDGSVSAFDRELTYEEWHWEPSDPAPCPLSGCLVGDLFVVAHRREVVALRVLNGTVEWRFEVDPDDRVSQVPASDGDLVYFGTEKGVLFALEVAGGKRSWRTETRGAFRSTLPLALADRVLVLDSLRKTRIEEYEQTSMLRAFQSYDGRELWSVRTESRVSNPGSDGDTVWLAGMGLGSWSAERGELVRNLWNRVEKPCGTPMRVGDSLVALEDENLLVVRDVASGKVRWAYRFGVVLHDFVHAGDQLYVATEGGLVCLVDDPEAKPAERGQAFGRPDTQRDWMLFRR